MARTLANAIAAAALKIRDGAGMLLLAAVSAGNAEKVLVPVRAFDKPGRRRSRA